MGNPTLVLLDLGEVWMLRLHVLVQIAEVPLAARAHAVLDSVLCSGNDALGGNQAALESVAGLSRRVPAGTGLVMGRFLAGQLVFQFLGTALAGVSPADLAIWAIPRLALVVFLLAVSLCDGVGSATFAANNGRHIDVQSDYCHNPFSSLWDRFKYHEEAQNGDENPYRYF